ncbi:MAG: DUF4388 domain-containing protein [Polyangiaceae bacterium]|nr:DUF4388 domain-containing protein [Polyangiaceae bacterium]
MAGAVEGNLRDVALKDVLEVLILTAQSGHLYINRIGRRAELYLWNGHIVTAQISPARRHLATFFLERGWITFDTLHRALLQQSRTEQHQLSGQILVELGVINREQLTQGLKWHVRQLLTELLAWPEGEFTFNAVVDPSLPSGEGYGILFELEDLERLQTMAVDLATANGRGSFERESWPTRPQLAIVITGDILVQHGLEGGLRELAFSVVHTPSLEDVPNFLLAAEDEYPTLVFDLDLFANRQREAEVAFDLLGSMRKKWPNLGTVTFGREPPDCLFNFLGKDGLLFHVPRPARSSEARLDLVKSFIQSLATVVLHSRSLR